ncbi:MAG: FAD-binding protein [Gammaproteobacteria bacterium]|nr:FAD-binding protein [Gammaproteobacteria bacterium]
MTISRRKILSGLGITTTILLSPLQLFATSLKEKIETFRDTLNGKLITRNDKNYELTRLSSVWQQVKPKQFPDCIVQAKNVDDVVAAVNFARTNHKQISIRCGGHSYYSSFLQNDKLMLDVSSLREVSIDTGKRQARVQVAMRSVDFMAEIAKHGFSFPAAHCGNVPLGGFLLGGGAGWNGEAWGGMSCFNISEVEVVTAQGQLIRANAEQNSDYYWAARGARPNFFGVVTEFVLDLYAEPKVILTTTLIWEVSRAKDVADWLEAHIRSMPENVEALFILTQNPDPKHEAGEERVCIVQVSAFSDTEAEARQALAPLSSSAMTDDCLAKTEYASTPIASLYEWDAMAYPQWRWDVDHLWSDDSAGDVVEKVIQHTRDMPSTRSSILLLLKPHTKELPDAAFSMIGSLYIACYAIWGSPDEDIPNNNWVKKTMTLLKENTKGHYVNESNYADNPERARGSFSAESLQKLKRLSSKHDPEHLFHSYL